MKKILAIFILCFSLVFYFGCGNLLSPQYRVFRNFENAKACNFEYGLINGSEYIKAYECVAEDNFISYILHANKNRRFIYDLENNIEYYEGYKNDYVTKLSFNLNPNSKVISLYQYMSRLKYTEGEKCDIITAKFNILKMSTDSLEIQSLGMTRDEIKQVFSDCYIRIYIREGKVEEMRIFPNYSITKDVYLKYTIYEYGDFIEEDIVLKDSYTNIDDYDDYMKNVNDDQALNMFPNRAPNGASLCIDYNPYIVPVQTKEFDIKGTLNNPGNYNSDITISSQNYLGDIDLDVPGAYEVVITIEVEGERVSDILKLYVIEEKELSATLIHDKFAQSSKQFSFDKYLGLAYDKSLYIYDYDNLNNEHLFDIKGRFSSYYYKDNYLYVSSNEDYQNYYDDYDKFYSYITKINLDTFEIEEQVRINRYISNIIVDKYGNIVFSKGGMKNYIFEMYNMETKAFTLISSNEDEVYNNDAVLLYDEVHERIIYISTKQADSPILFRYDKNTNNYRYVEVLDHIFGPDIYNKLSCYRENEVIFGDRIFDFSKIKNNYYKFYNLSDLYYGFEKSKIGGICDNIALVALRTDDKYIIGVMDTITFSQTNIIIENIDVANSLLNDIHYYDGNIYIYDDINNKLWCVEYK